MTPTQHRAQVEARLPGHDFTSDRIGPQYGGIGHERITLAHAHLGAAAGTGQAYTDADVALADAEAAATHRRSVLALRALSLAVLADR